jgi:outer membrane protein OmpA-like peptidoglycan-associated protein
VKSLNPFETIDEKITIRMKKSTLLLSLLMVSFQFLSQKDPCLTDDKKLIKAMEPFKNEQDPDKAALLFKVLVEKYPDNAELPYLMAKKAYAQSTKLAKDPKKANSANQYQKQAFILFTSSYKKCNSFHADNLYFIASIMIGNGDSENAISYLQSFVDFPEDDFTKISSDHDEKKKAAKTFLDKLEASKRFTDNPVPFEPILIDNVSSELDEYFPMISPDNDLMFFTRKVNRKSLGDISDNIIEEFTVSERMSTQENNFNGGSPMLKPFNDGTFFNYGTASLSADNKEMILCACKKETVYSQNYLNCDLYTTTFKRTGKGGNDFQWTSLVNMGEGINTKDGWEAQPSLSADGKLLFYATFRTGSQNNDIYFSERKDDGTWSAGKPFTAVNTPGKDKSPFFHQDGETLYFVSETSEARPGLGGLDIFYIRKTDKGWTEPENIGYPINTSGDELGLFVSTQGKLAYYSSYQNGNWNIYGFELYEKAQPKEVVIIKGELKDEKGQAVTDAKIEIENGMNGTKQTIQVNKEDGKYAAVVKVKKEEPLTVTLKKEGTAFNSQVLTKENLSSNSVKVDMSVEKLKPGKSYNINDILFGTDSYVLAEKSKLILSRFADYLKENGTLKISIHGHTDDLGDDNQNLLLSQNRAKAVKDFIVSNGIDAKRVSSEGFGEKKPKVPNTNNENRAKNRRTEFLLISE